MNKISSEKVGNPTFTYLLFFASLAALYAVSRIDFLIFHLIAELYSIIIAFSMFAILWNSRRYLTNNYLMIIGIGFVFAAAIDFIHMLSYKGMPFLSGHTTNLPTQLWIAARYLQAFTYVFAAVFNKRKLNIWLVLGIYAGASSLLVLSIFKGIFPDCYIDGVGLTQFKKISEYIISFILMVGGSLFYKHRNSFAKSVFGFLSVSLIATVVSELLFTLYIGTSGLFSLLGHLFKIIAFFFVSRALIKVTLEDPHAVIFRELKEKELELEDARNHYQTLFMEAPIRIWEEDYSLVKREIDRLRSEGVQDFQTYFSSHPEVTKQLTGFVKILSYNKAVDKAFPEFDGSEINTLANKVLGNVESEMHREFTAISHDLHNLSYETSSILADGSTNHKLISWSAVAGHEQDYSRVIVLIQDITEIKLIEQKLRESEERYRLLFNNAGIGIGYYDLLGNTLMLNEKALQNMGGKLETFINRNAIDVYGPEMGQKIISRINSASKTDQTEEYEDFTELPAGNKWFISSYTRILNNKSECTGVQIISQDITERKQLENQIREYSEGLELLVKERTTELERTRDKLIKQEKLAIMGQLASGVGHELRNPLAVINNALYILNSTLKDQDERTTTYLRMIGQEVGTADKIISDLLSFARIKSVDRSETSLPLLVNKVLDRYFPPENISVEQKLAQDLLPVLVDSGQIEQVLINLITNAYQAMPDGGKLIISGFSDKGRAGLIIKDSGAGIEKENLEKIFEPLFTTKPKGIGLGLTVTKLLTEANDGTINVESKIGKGAAFTITLPTK